MTVISSKTAQTEASVAASEESSDEVELDEDIANEIGIKEDDFGSDTEEDIEMAPPSQKRRITKV